MKTGEDLRKLLRPAAFLRQAATYGIGGIAGQILNIATLPIISRILRPSGYGALELAVTVGSLGTILALAGMNSGVLILYRRDDAHRRQVAGTGLMLVFLFAAALAAVLLPLSPVVARLAGGDESIAPVVTLSILWVPLNVVASLSSDFLRLAFRPYAYATVTFGRACIGVALGLLLAGPMGFGADGVLLGYIAAAVVCGGIALVQSRDTWTPSLQWPIARQLLLVGLPLIPAGLALWGVSYADRFFLSSMRDLQAVGLYAVANRLSAMPMLAIAAFQAAWWPYALARSRQPAYETEFAAIATLYVASLVVLASGAALFAPELVAAFASPAYAQASSMVGLLSLGVLANGLVVVFGVGIAITQRTGALASAAIAALILNTVLNLVLVPTLGGQGAALATVLAYSCYAIWTLLAAQRHNPIPYAGHPLAVLLAGAVACVAASRLVDGSDGIAFLVRFACFVALCAMATVVSAPWLRSLRSVQEGDL